MPYRVVNVAAGDLGLSAAKKYDIEAWFSGQGAGVRSGPVEHDQLQARRLDIRCRPEHGGPQEVHTLNGITVTDRSLIAILENFQEEDGSVAVPLVLERFGAPSRVGAAG